MNVKLVEYLAQEKLNYERGLVSKDDVKMWLSVFAQTYEEFEEAEKQVGRW